MIPAVCVGIRGEYQRCITPAEADEVPPCVPYVVLFPVVAGGTRTFAREQYNGQTWAFNRRGDHVPAVRIIRERTLPMPAWSWTA